MKRKYQRISFADRKTIENSYNCKHQNAVVIAKKLGVHHATIYRELQRGKTNGMYNAMIAQKSLIRGKDLLT